MSAQHKNSGGLLANSLHNMVGDALLEVPMWLRLARPVPSVAQELTKMADKLRVPVASVTGIVRTYNKVSAFARPPATAVARDCSGRRQAHARGLRQMHVQPCAHVVRARWPHAQSHSRMHAGIRTPERGWPCAAQALGSLTREERRLFHDRMRQVDRRVMPGINKLTWMRPKPALDAYCREALW